MGRWPSDEAQVRVAARGVSWPGLGGRGQRPSPRG